MLVFTLELRMYENVFFPKFAFDASDYTDARIKADVWAQYHGFGDNDVAVRLATDNERENWLHNEYIQA